MNKKDIGEISAILGEYSEENKKQNTNGLSTLNQFVANMGYRILNFNQMLRLSRIFNITEIKTVDDIMFGKKGRELILKKLNEHFLINIITETVDFTDDEFRGMLGYMIGYTCEGEEYKELRNDLIKYVFEETGKDLTKCWLWM